MVVQNSSSYNAFIVEDHFHNFEKWFGAAAVPSGETHVADRIGPSATPFTITAGNDAWGSWVQILGSSDTPVISGSKYYDAHRILIEAASTAHTYLIQIIHGESADIAAKLAAEEVTEFPFLAPNLANDLGVAEVRQDRFMIAEKLWARCICPGQNAPTLDFYYGIHEYPK